MSHLAEDIDSVPLETRAESTRVESGLGALDPVATKIAFDQEQPINSPTVVPTVAVPTSATVDPDAGPLMTRLGAMSIQELKTYIKDGIATGEQVLVEEKRIADRKRQVTYEVLCALRELRSRLKATKGWEKALRDCGIAPGTWRSWDCRELNQLTTGRRTKSRNPKPDGRSLAQVRAGVVAAKAAVDAQRAASLAQPDPVEVEAEYIDEPVDSPAIALAKKVIETYKELASGVQPSILRWDALKELAESVLGVEPPSPSAPNDDDKPYTLSDSCIPTLEPWQVRAAALAAEQAAAKAKAKAEAKTAAETAEPKICPKCGKQYSRNWVRLYDRDIRYRHTGKRDATRDEDCYVPFETETTDTGVSVTPTTQTTNLKVKEEATI